MKRSRTGTGDLVQVNEKVRRLRAPDLVVKDKTMKTLIIALTLVALSAPALACGRATCPKGATCICKPVAGQVQCEVISR